MWKFARTLLRQGNGKALPSICCRRELNVQNEHDIDKSLQRQNSGIYKNAGFFQSKTGVAKQLMEDIVYYDPTMSDLLVVNKPYGLPLHPGDQGEISLNCALPELASALNVPKISVIKSCGRFTSGCTLLNTGSERCTKHVNKCRKRNQANRKLGSKYLAITNGVPKSSAALECVDVSLQPIKGKKSMSGGVCKEPVIYRELMSQSKLKRSKTKSNLPSTIRFSVIADTISTSPGSLAALVSIQPTDVRWNFVCAYMANLLSPIIGDSQFSYRVKTLLGKPVKVSHEHSPLGHQSNSLPGPVLDRLGISKNHEEHLPVHLHLYRVHLPGFFNESDLTVHAPPPKYFLYTAQALKLSINIDELQQLDKICEYNIKSAK